MKKKTKTSASNISGEKIASLINELKDRGAMLQEKKTTAGFDGFIDTIVHVIKRKIPGGHPLYLQPSRNLGIIL